jgi:hypothetical protein
MSDQPQNLQVNVPEGQVAGSYANLVGVWHTPHEFAIDFCVVQPFAGAPDTLAAQVVSRVRIAPTLVFELLRAINQDLGEYEEQFGEIKRLVDYERGDDDD